MVVVPRGARVAGSIALTTWLDPDESVLQFESSARGGTGAKASADGVAPITPGGLTSWLLARSALVRNEVSTEACVRQERSNGIDVKVLVVVGVAFRKRSNVSQFTHLVKGRKTDLRCRTAQC